MEVEKRICALAFSFVCHLGEWSESEDSFPVLPWGLPSRHAWQVGGRQQFPVDSCAVQRRTESCITVIPKIDLLLCKQKNSDSNGLSPGMFVLFAIIIRSTNMFILFDNVWKDPFIFFLCKSLHCQNCKSLMLCAVSCYISYPLKCSLINFCCQRTPLPLFVQSLLSC